jgi:Raf kinase inhibitor-like YbhB/YbcL family protein
MAFEIMSPAFAKGEAIPRKYTCDGGEMSPPLSWRNAPPETRSFALIADGPDAPMGTWIHWVLYNMPAQVNSLPEGVLIGPSLPDGGQQGKNGSGQLGYQGPCPPSGTHRYFFRLYALDKLLKMSPGASREQLLKAMTGHILAQAELVGSYTRR